jgi:prepilin-type N-terminal cleavage/methylation domain-containing protein
MKTLHCAKRAFTLVELLVTIGIIALLAGILLPALRAAFVKAEKAQAQTDVKGIESAIRAYFNEYSKIPAPDGWQGNDKDASSASDSREVIHRLMTNNPRRIVFLEVSSGPSDGTFLDPWDTQYAVYLDTDYSGDLTVGSNKVFAPGAAVSAGPDKTFTVTAGKDDDNIYSFK